MKMQLIVLLVVLVGTSAFGLSYSPWLNSERVPDWSGNWESFRNYSTLQGKTGQDFAIGVYNIFKDKSLGIMHVGGTVEPFINTVGYDYTQLWCYKAIRDPVKIMNLNGWGWCGQEGSNMAGAMQQAGVGPTHDIGWNGHGLMEVYYGGAWHYFDADLRGYVANPATGEVASAQQAIDSSSWVLATDYNCAVDATYIRNLVWPNGAFLAQRLWTSSHTMDFALRMGETFTRYWKGDSTRYFNSIDWYNGFPHIGNNILTTSYNGVVKENGMPCHGRPYSYCSGYYYATPGMGIFQYAPNLNSAYADYRDGVTIDSNVTQDNAGAGVPSGQNGYIVFDRFTPYILCGKNGLDFTNLSNQTGQTEGAVVTLALLGNANVRVSRNNGHTWTILGTNVTGTQTFDFTHTVYGFYQYMIRIDLLDGAKLTSYAEKAVVSAAPASLPLISGTTQMQFRTGDRYGFRTKTYLMDLDLHDSTQNLPATVTNHQPTSVTTRATGAIVKVNPPGNGKIRWLSIGGAFARTQNPGVEISTDGTHYTPIWNAGSYSWTTCPYRDCHWEAQFDTSVIFTTGPAGATYDWGRAAIITANAPESVWVKYTNNVNMIRIYAHYEEPDRPMQESPVTIINATDSGSVQQSFDSTAAYTVSALTGHNLWYSMSVASQENTELEKAMIDKMILALEIAPNPFNPVTRIRSQNPGFGNQTVEIEICTVHGKVVDKLHATSYELSAGIIWDAARFPSGLYIVRVKAGNRVTAKPVMLMK
ncbi:MAG: hypothetical protein A2268_05280 [Candidatus Raymondbacteria bacterium RifOxyA12_full_50_37]|uniref:Uncharacterized protein n=1 Tax=Candidatus Raymondbacteria bacterium RIFOXYD12_FULL_49_13 TaxID=1817890 RepID=A0A1F7FBG1_UNCRA|nr:MAG: hypothetical protein A2268_05280 [Candidatus Raymondbacteria bacterium RifOxyA12_full_50_37]OGJ88979.1 MAG: hypothetical protein A2248_02515 [Candidatus Raymondbacteria bacterium RIFOXYA2_FULL_49_16]OGJ97007.1 MAG: hypothetical protein A2453_03935 [Candidatus Raymondbacteria bacterium RIFOXYC2_FULL_50_21]OGK04005.1 MAG: hypothetical protein A2519_00675 [Candidatus Raymondbacteria bacterium RIFOXYD12_FULL_49_13]OGK04069.1 MAG: hypothetical protein A2350_04130 [Candidatus Raymondbacteria 